MKNNLLIVGAGGLGQVIAEIASTLYTDIAFLDDQPTDDKQKQYKIIGTVQDASKFTDAYTYAIPAFGNNRIRYEILIKLRQWGFIIPRIIHPSAVVSPTAIIGEGTIIRALAGISREVLIGEGCLINMGAMIDHGCKIGYGSHIPMNTVIRNEVEIPPMSRFTPGVVIEKNNTEGTDWNEILNRCCTPG